MKVLQEMINYLKSLNKFFKKNHYVKTMMMTMMTNLRPMRMKRGITSDMTPCVS